MAQSNKVLLQLVECAVCLSVFDNPYQLNCLHAFCYGCLMKLLKGDTIVCPNCRKDSSLQEIKKDFKSQEILDVYNLQMKEQRESEVLEKLLGSQQKKNNCQVCENVSKVGQLKCVECDQVMCRQCEKVHKSIKSCKGHTVVPNDDILAVLKEKIDSDRKELEQQRKHSVDALEADLYQNLAKMSTWQSESIATLEETENHHISRVKQHYARLKESVNELNSELVKGLQEQDYIIQRHSEEIQILEKNLASGMETAMLDGLLRIVDIGVKETKSKIAELSKTLSQYESKVTVPPRVSVICGGELELHKATHLIARNCAFESIVNDSVSRMIQNRCTYSVTTSKKLDYIPQRLRVIDEKMVCIGTNNNISVFDLDCQFCEKVVEPNLRDIRSLTEVHSGYLVVACDNSVGLHILNQERKYLGAIAIGSFSDVTSCSLAFYALEYEQCKVMVFTESGGRHKWMQVNEVKLTYDSRHSNSWDTLGVTKEGIFVCALKTCSIYQYSHSGQLLQQFGEKGSGGLGKLRHPRLGFVDCESSALILDTQNDRLQVYNSRTSRWSPVDIAGNVVVPLDATVSSTAENIWIIQDSCGTPYLTKCELN